MPAGPIRFRSCIDAPHPGSPGTAAAWVRGWCFEESGLIPTGVRARIGRTTVNGIYGWERLDVRQALGGPPASDHCGFGVAVRLPPGDNPVRLEAEIPGHGWIEFASLALPCSWPVFLRQTWQRTRFRVAARMGFTQAYRILRAAEREFRFGELEQVRQPLRVAPQHAPIALTPERFPAGRMAPSQLPGIAVVTPSFQQGRFLEAAMRSVLDQDGVRLAYGVEDGGSADNTRELLERYGPRLAHWTSQPDAGQADAVRRGFARLGGGPDDVMAWINSDDCYLPGALRFVAEYFARHPGVDVVFGHRVFIDEQGGEVGRWFTPRGCVGDDLAWFDLVPQETLFWRRRLWDRVGGVDPSYQYALDWDLLLRFKAAGARFARLPWFLGCFRLHPAQKSRTQLEMTGVPESDALRRRALGREPNPDEFSWRMLRAQIESARLRARASEGCRAWPFPRPAAASRQ